MSEEHGVDEFRPGSLRAHAALFTGVLTFAFAASVGAWLCLVVSEVWLGIGFLSLGVAALGSFVSLSRMKVVVGPGGIAKRTRPWLGGFDIRWAEVAEWSIGLSDAEETPWVRVARFRVPRRGVEVSEGDVSAQGFEPFLAAVRRRISARETPG